MFNPMYDTAMPHGFTLQVKGGTQKVVELSSMPPRSGPVACIVRTDFGCDVIGPADVTVSFGVSQPSEAQYPMRPFVGYAHPVAHVILSAGERHHVHLVRWDIINPKVLATPIPWQLVGAPHLTGEVTNNGSHQTAIENICFVSEVHPLV